MTRILRRVAHAVAIAASIAPAISGAQDADRELAPPPAIALESFRLSGPPALSLLGASAASVSRPNTPRDLIASLVSGAGANGIVPNGYAIETAPYWLVRRRGLSLEQYHKASLADRLKFFSAISVATERQGAPGDSSRGAHAAIALRTLLANGRPNAKLLATRDSMRRSQLDYIERYRRLELAQSGAAGIEARRRRLAQQEDLLSSLLARVIVQPTAASRDSAMRTLARRDSLRTIVAAGESASGAAAGLETDLDRIEARLATLAKRFATQEIEPDGFIMELAAGTRAFFEESQWGEQRVDGLGVWATPMYRDGTRGLELIGVLRYLTRVSEYQNRDLLDVGARLGVDVGKGSVSAEHVWRSLNGDGGLGLNEGAPADVRKTTTRWSFVFDYPLGSKLGAVASFGSDYRRTDGDRPVIATVGINLGFGAIEVLPMAR